jgi:hypothetical protein
MAAKVHLVAFWQFGISVLKEHTVSVFMLVDGGRMFF